MRLLALLLVATPCLASILPGLSSRTGKAAQDGHVKYMAPLISDFHLHAAGTGGGRKLLSQLQLSEERLKVHAEGAEREMGREVHGGGERSAKRDDSAGRAGKRARIGERALQWVQQVEYSGKSFFDGPNTRADQVTESRALLCYAYDRYVDREAALAQGLAFWTDDGAPGIQVEHWAQTVPGTPRNSVRIHSKALYAGGLFLIDMKLMPWGCGVWPAFWTLGYYDTWPYHGEIDIIEGIQSMTNNQMTLHTLPGCTTNQSPGLFSGTVSNPNCDSTTGGAGCSIISNSPISYGMPFNEQGGGVFAMLWDGTGIRMWNWNRAQIPNDILVSKPLPGSWGMPAAAWDASTCNPYTYFQAQQLILNVNLCGDWAGANFAQYPYCPGTCPDYVSTPTNLNNTIMLVNYIKVFQQANMDFYEDETGQSSDNVTGVGGAVGGDSVLANGRTGRGSGGEGGAGGAGGAGRRRISEVDMWWAGVLWSLVGGFGAWMIGEGGW